MCCCGGSDDKDKKNDNTGCCGGGEDNKDKNDAGGCCSCCGGGNEKQGLETWRQKKKELTDYKFKDVDVSKFRDTGFCMLRRYGQMLSVSTNYFLFIALDIQVSYWLFKADPTLYPNAKACGAAYAAFSALNIAWLLYNIYKAYTIINSGDISDAFIHHESYRFLTITNYNIFCFFTQITFNRTCRDKTVLYVFDSLYQIPQIIFIKAPQAAILLTSYQALGLFASTEEGASIPKSQPSADLKFGFLMAELGFRVFAVFILWPWVRCCMNKRSLPEYANYLIESQVNALVKTGKADLNQPEEQDKGGCCC